MAQLKLNDRLRRDVPIVSAVNTQHALNAQGLLPLSTNDDPIHWADMQSLSERYNTLPSMADEEIELLAQDIAIYLHGQLADLSEAADALDTDHQAQLLYAETAAIVKHFKQQPVTRQSDLVETVVAINRMRDIKWWHTRLRKVARRWREHLQIAYGDVSRNQSLFCSAHWVSAWENRRQRTRAILERLELEDQDTGERISLMEQINKSVSNPELRRTELMTRIGGFERIAKDAGYVGMFFTLTAPSKYHARNHQGHRNPKWLRGGQPTPAQTQKYFTRLWSQIRTALSREEIRYFGVRVVEPHHDGTPHWHGLLFVTPGQADALSDIMRQYAVREDADELQTRHGEHPRFSMKPIESEYGTATGYIVKYISKNIDGYALDGEVSDEGNKPCKLTARHATAWASLWGIKQFQFLGGAPVSVWRELRRLHNQALADGISPIMGELHKAADTGDWQQYVMLQGGPFAARRDLKLRIYYQEKSEPNQYGEYANVIKGVYLQQAFNISPVETRTRSWRIVRKKTPERAGANQGVDVGFDLTGASAPARTRVNNCTLHQNMATACGKIPPSGIPEQLTIEHTAYHYPTLAQLRQMPPPTPANGTELGLRLFDLADLIGRGDLPSPANGVRRADETQEQADARETQRFIEALTESASRRLRTEMLWRESTPSRRMPAIPADGGNVAERRARIQQRIPAAQLEITPEEIDLLARGCVVRLEDGRTYRASRITGELLPVTHPPPLKRIPGRIREQRWRANRRDPRTLAQQCLEQWKVKQAELQALSVQQVEVSSETPDPTEHTTAAERAASFIERMKRATQSQPSEPSSGGKGVSHNVSDSLKWIASSLYKEN
ncbi:replication endonuclease [Edwardsiella tarda]|uniref:replication endonuclease n=1 Tax=Edwardsiella tarda TaxID=636 RepID=UPI003F65984F